MLLDDLVQFKAFNRVFRFVDMSSPGMMRVYEEGSKEGQKTATLGILDVRDVSTETLKEIGVWDQLDEETQMEILEGLTEKTQIVHEAARKRNRTHSSLPTELKCIKCGKTINIVASVLSDRIQKQKDIHGEDYDYIKNYQCQKCNPTKGRKKNADINKYPKFMKCKCGHQVNVSIPQLKAKAEKLNTSIEELIKNYECQTCHPSKRGRIKA
jgi:transcription elongation factor Elf1